jgi:hypothetical protein
MSSDLMLPCSRFFTKLRPPNPYLRPFIIQSHLRYSDEGIGRRNGWQLGMKVGELTGDSQTTKQQIVSEASIIVTIPEKWDVVSLKQSDIGETSHNRRRLRTCGGGPCCEGDQEDGRNFTICAVGRSVCNAA